MRRQVVTAAAVLAAVGINLPATSYADTAGGTNGPIVYSDSAATAVPGHPAYQVWSINPDGSGRRELLAGRAELNTHPAWSPDGLRLAFYRGTHLVAARVDGSEEHEVLRNVGATVSWSPDGTRLAYTVQDPIGQGTELRVVNADGTDAHAVYRADGLGSPAWSPRGDVIAFGADDPDQIGANELIYTVTVDGTDLHRLTSFDPTGPRSYVHMDYAPTWSPDGTLIAFVSDRDRGLPVPCFCETYDLYVMSSEGSGPVTRLADSGWEGSPSWSPDGTSLAYSWTEVQTSNDPPPKVDGAIKVWDLATGAVRRLTSANGYGVSWSAKPGSRPSADLSAVLAADATSVLPGSPVTLTATVRNSGPLPAEAAAVEVRAAPGSTLDPAGSPGCAAAAGGALRCTVGALAAGGQASFTVRTTTGGAGVGEASALAVSATSDPDTINNRATLSVAVCTKLGTPRRDRLQGTAGPDVLCGMGGDDVLVGRGGDDVLVGGPGRDRLSGAGGKDTVSYAQSRQRVRVDLTRGTAEGHGADRLRRVENAVGSRYDDRLAGSARANVLVGGAGTDWLAPGAGPDRLDGGLGQDRVDYRDAGRAVHLDLDKRNGTGQGTDRWVSVEGAFGTRFADEIIGSLTADWVASGGGEDRVEALGGNDRVSGGSGADVLRGGDGNDHLSGGAGLDRCRQDYGRGRPRSCERR